MPVTINSSLPAVQILSKEGIFIMPSDRAEHQDIRPLRIAILNIMPTKVETETQLLRLLSNSPLQIEIVFLHPETYQPKNTSAKYLAEYYKTFSEVENIRFDGLIITGAPVEQLDFEQVKYWEELERIMKWSRHHVFSTLHICWGAQAGLYYHYGIPKYPLEKKMFGVFEHQISGRRLPLLRGFDDVLYAPHSRHSEIRAKDIKKVKDLKILSQSEEAGVYLVTAKNGRQVFITGHCEYDALTLRNEYLRDLAKGLPIEIPKNYFPGDDPEKPPIVRWRAHANLLFSNWLNYYVYQETPYDLTELTEG